LEKDKKIGKSDIKRRHNSGITNQHYYQVDCFNDVINWLLQVLETHSMILV
jgi:hypothetical protein